MLESKQEFFTYKGKPLVRCNNTIYYGDMRDPYVVMLQINSTTDENGMELSDKIHVQLMKTAKDIKPQDIVVKKSEKNGIYNALDIAEIWLNKALSE